MEKKYPIGGFAPGSYYCKCGSCGVQFDGDKRAVQCEPCAVKSIREILKPYDEQAQTGNNENPGCMWVNGAPVVRSEHFARVKDPVSGNIRKAAIWPVTGSTDWFANVFGLTWQIKPESIVAYILEKRD